MVTDPTGYRLEVEAHTVDISRFGAAAALGRTALGAGDDAAASAHLGDALRRWRGRSLDGPDDGALHREATRLEEARLAALEDRCAADLLLGRHAELVGEVEGLVAPDPCGSGSAGS